MSPLCPVVSRHDGIASPVSFGAALSKGSGSGSLDLRATRTKLSLPSSPASQPLLRKWGNCAWHQTAGCATKSLVQQSVARHFFFFGRASGCSAQAQRPHIARPICRFAYSAARFPGGWRVPRFSSCPEGRGMIHRVAHATKKKLGPRKPLAVTLSQSMRLMPLMKTGRYWCKFPVRENADAIGGYLCCGRATMRDDVYCAEHRAIASPAGRPPLKPPGRQ